MTNLPHNPPPTDTEAQEQAVSTALQPYEQDAPVRVGSDNSEPQAYVDKIFELSVHNINLAIVSDYQAELELFYIHFTVCLFCM